MNLKKGFTLIELLVVVAILGILATIVLSSTDASRARGRDAAIKSNLHTVKNQAEAYFLDYESSYLPPGGSTFEIATCPTYNPSGTNMLTTNKVLADAIAEAVNKGEGSSCYNSEQFWAVAIGLRSAPNTSWCVDTQGVARFENTPASAAINPSTFLCN